MAYIVMAYIVVACMVVAYVVMALRSVRNQLGNPFTEELLHQMQPSYWYAAQPL